MACLSARAKLLIISITYSLLRIMGSRCGKTSLLSLPCGSESVKTRASSGMYQSHEKVSLKVCVLIVIKSSDVGSSDS